MTDETESTEADLAAMWAAGEPVDLDRRSPESPQGLRVEQTVGTFSRAPSARFEVYRDADGGFRWHLRASNGRVIAASEAAYSTKASAVSSIAAVQRDVPEAVTSDLT